MKRTMKYAMLVCFALLACVLILTACGLEIDNAGDNLNDNSDKNDQTTNDADIRFDEIDENSIIINKNSLKIHFASCGWVDNIANDAMEISSLSVEDLIASGYIPCGSCMKNIFETTDLTTQPETKPEPDADQDISIINITSPVSVNSNATITIKGKPNTEYDINVYYSSGISKAKGLENKISDENGTVSWTWKVGAKTKKGEYKIIVKDENNSIETYFEVN